MLSRRAFLRAGTAGAAALAAFTNDSLARAAAAADAAAGRTRGATSPATRTTGTRSSRRSRSIARSSISTTAAAAPAPGWSTKPSSAISTSRTKPPCTTCGRSSSRTSRPYAGGSRPSSAAIPKKWPSRATRARRCRSRSWVSTSRRATRSSPRIRTTAGCWTRGTSAHAATRSSSRESRFRSRRRRWTTSPTACCRPSRRGPRSCTSATSRTSPGRSFPSGRSVTRRARKASRPSSTAPTRSRISRTRPRTSAATTTAPACTSGCSRRSARGFSTSGERHIEALWPLTPANATRAKDIRKFEEIGTHPAANHNAIAEALTFHDGDRQRAQGRAAALSAKPLGGSPAARRAGSRFTPAWIRRSRARSAPCRSSASRPPRSCPQLWDKWRIIATPIVHAEYEGLRVTPNVYTTLEEIDTFAGAMMKIVVIG